MKRKIAEFGSISHGTMRPEDLIPDFIRELRNLGHRAKELTEIEKRYDRAQDDYFESEESSWDLDTLFDMLNDYAPAWGYFGAHPGDGSDYGFWLSEDFEDDYDGLKVSDTSEIPAGYVGEILHVNDHGNMTLYWKSPRKLREIWSVV